ncbi:fimbrial outer membrane usher protein SthC [Pseudomonas fluorescens HK44]|uniref:Fimbrial outer membrane usher protein SthC n=1 Tax=Pseudomonas fluorescens HK44 TaxID=1042209 RepID=A0A010SS11_PSEFL|nr:fimbria/pilus outer membrane usher protein [Pseudomonas fluorescens]EXF95615.1 fimbrial outer membrane usher protein SthC [Pseudomonas fluorescens HK44]
MGNVILASKFPKLSVTQKAAITFIAVVSTNVFSADYFNPNALEKNVSTQGMVDLDQFSSQGAQVPGEYRVDVYLNGSKVETREVSFVALNGQLQPEITREQLKNLGVKVEAFSTLQSITAEGVVENIGNHIPSASYTLNFSQQRLDISIPQAALKSEAREYVDPASWDQGLPALLFNYTYTGSNTRYDNSSGTGRNAYLSLQSGTNLGAWRLRNYSTYSDDGRGNKHWGAISTYAQRDIQPLKGQLTLGESFTPSDIFDSVQFQGAQLSSDDNMLPDSLKGFAPVVRGIAQTNAQVTVRQNGYIIYQTYVAPGAFAITDLYPTSSSGDLEVIIKEANGTERRSVQPFSSVPTMVREGQLKYAVTAAKFRSQSEGARTPNFLQSTLIYGLPYDTTLYGGLLTADKYDALAVGVGHSFGNIGSLSFDVTQANAELSDRTRHQGQSFRTQYAKDIEQTGTSFTLAGYRYASSGFYDFREANEIGADNDNSWRSVYNKRSKTQLNVNQSLKGYGSVYVSGYQQTYWGRQGYERNISTGYNFSHSGINYNFSYTYSTLPSGTGSESDQQLAFSVQVPLDRFMPRSWASYSVSSSKNGDTVQQVGLNGTALADNNLSYSAQQSRGTHNGSSGNLSSTYRGAYGEASASYNYGESTQQVTYGVQGGVVVHPYGVTLSQPLGDTVALIRAPGAEGIKIQSNPGIQTDSRGYAVVPYVSAYRKNRISLDTQSMNDDVDIAGNTQTVIPTQGAVVLANFVTRVGSRVMMTVSYKGQPVPFGAAVEILQTGDNTAPNSGIVGSDGEVYLSGVSGKGRLAVKWGSGIEQRCEADFVLPPAAPLSKELKQSSVLNAQAVCQ